MFDGITSTDLCNLYGLRETTIKQWVTKYSLLTEGIHYRRSGRILVFNREEMAKFIATRKRLTAKK